MASVNKVIIVGNLGRDPETKYMPDGKAITNVSIATSYKKRDSEQEETEWHRVIFFERLAEVAGEYLKKGSSVYVEGRLRTRKWQDKEGQDRYTTEIVATQMQMLGARPNGGAGAAPEEPSQPRSEPKAPQPTKKPAGKFDDMEDDIPF